jgi:hypothetical protein
MSNLNPQKPNGYERYTEALSRELLRVSRKKSDAFALYKKLERLERDLRRYIVYRNEISCSVQQAVFGLIVSAELDALCSKRRA